MHFLQLHMPTKKFSRVVLAGSLGLTFSFPIGLTIVGVLIVAAIYYYQTIHGYLSGGGSYIVAHENLGVIPGLVAAAALLIDYVLTVDVEVIASAFPTLWPYRMETSLLLLLMITLINIWGCQGSRYCNGCSSIFIPGDIFWHTRSRVRTGLS